RRPWWSQMSMNLAKIALHVAADPPKNRTRTLAHAGYVREILAHAGFFFEEIERSWISLFEPSAIQNPNAQYPRSGCRAPEIQNPAVLLLVGDTALTEEETQSLDRWIEAGGCVIGVASHSGAPSLFGVR